MNIQTVRDYFNDHRTVNHYLRAVANVGLWRSEAQLFQQHLAVDAELLDLGCGVGRIALGLWRMGFRKVTGADLAENMVEEAKRIASVMQIPVAFRQEDATRLSMGDGSFNGVVFGFNGLMQIPGKANRLAAMKEVKRVLRADGVFIFTTLDRDTRLYRRLFADENCPDHNLKLNAHLLDYGDRHFETDHGITFMHVPDQAEVEELLDRAGFEQVSSKMRSEICREEEAVREFSEDCRFWVAKKPADDRQALEI